MEAADQTRRRRLPTVPRAALWRWGSGAVMAAVSVIGAALVACNTRSRASLPVRHVSHWPMPADGPRVPAPRSIATDGAGTAYVLDTAGRVLAYRSDGKLLRHWSMPETAAGKPEGICVLRDGRIVVCDTHYHRVVLFRPDGALLESRGEYGRGPGQFIYPVAVTEDDAGNLYVAEYGSNDRIQKFAPDGVWLTAFGGFGTDDGQLQRPSGLVWSAGKIYIADAINERVVVYSDGGRCIGTLGAPAASPATELRLPYDIALGADGALLVVEYGAGRLTQLRASGEIAGSYGTPGSGCGQFLTPWGVAVTAAGRILVADTGNRRIVELQL